MTEEKFRGSNGNGLLKNFATPLQSSLLNIEEKNRSNLFAWRGQFSPQLVEYLLDSYCIPGSVILDPFAGSGTVLCEAAAMRLPGFGFEINPAAWCFSKIYEFANVSNRGRNLALDELSQSLNEEFPTLLLVGNALEEDAFTAKISKIGSSLSDRAKILCNALVVLLDVYNKPPTNNLVQSKFSALSKLVIQLPFSEQPIKADLQDARALPLEDESVDFVITSPPYINVFNYHQNYRRSVEILGWNLLRVARSEIGSNRANRGNRFLTVIQYCIDMTHTLKELARVTRSSGRVVLIIGHESKVLGVPFYNADILDRIARESGFFDLVLRQKRVFLNRFGEEIREDVLSLEKVSSVNNQAVPITLGRNIACEVLEAAMQGISNENSQLLQEAIERVNEIDETPLFNSSHYALYQTRKDVMMVKEEEDRGEYMKNQAPVLPTPHLDKLKKLLHNRSLPGADKPRIEDAIQRYRGWISELERIKPGQKDAVKQLVETTNRYKIFIELTLIFDSPENFLYRQKGQLKLDNTILEEFLPHLFYRGLRLEEHAFEFGPHSTFAGLSFTSSIAKTGVGGQPTLRTKNQDFVLGKQLFIMTSFDKKFSRSEVIETQLGYVCVECKTNLDKTMFQEAVASSRDLKIAVPSSLYFLVCEFLDMTPVSIVSTQIDDVLIVRKAKRMSSNVRQEYKDAAARRKHRNAYADFLEASKYYADVFQRMIDKVQNMVDVTDPETDKVLSQGHF